MVKVYPAILYKEDGYWIEFPDLEGCQTFGSTLEETMELAQEALGLYLVSLMERKLPVPDPSSIEEIEVPANAKLVWVKADTLEYKKRDEVLGALKTEKMAAYYEMQKLRKQTAAYKLKDCEAERDNAVSEKFGEFMKV